MRCPSFEKIIDYLDGSIDTDEAARTKAHLETGCSMCAATQQWYERVNLLTSSDDLTEPPPWVLKRALKLFESQRARGSVIERIGRAVASLVFDSLARPAIAGVRSTDTANRQLLYRAGDYNIDLQIAPIDEARAELIGQVLREGENTFQSVAELSLNLKGAGETQLSSKTNQLGEFAFNNVDQGNYDLSIETPEGVITIQGLPVTQSL